LNKNSFNAPNEKQEEKKSWECIQSIKWNACSEGVGSIGKYVQQLEEM